jgi:hypothetical protein
MRTHVSVSRFPGRGFFCNDSCEEVAGEELELSRIEPGDDGASIWCDVPAGFPGKEVPIHPVGKVGAWNPTLEPSTEVLAGGNGCRLKGIDPRELYPLLTGELCCEAWGKNGKDSWVAISSLKKTVLLMDNILKAVLHNSVAPTPNSLRRVP